MNKTYRLLLCAAAAWAAAAVTAGAAETGRVLVLTNEHTVEGDIEHVGDQYRIRHPVGETWVPGDKVMRLCANMDEAYRVLRGRANLNDSDELVRLARWCHGHGLPARALECAEAAVTLSPTSAEARHLLSGLQRAATATPAPSAAPAALPGPLDMPEVSTESRAAFAAKVEPILMNACAGCHAANRGGSFKLARTYDTTSPNRLSLQRNLAAVLAQVNLQQPQDSKLLIKAITAHDPQARFAPLNTKQMAAYHTMEDWVQTTVANNPHLRERAPQTTAAEPPKPTAAVAAKPVPPAAFATARPAKAQTGAVDEFDPVLFNRRGRTDDARREDK
jgi:hypothetical protein